MNSYILGVGTLTELCPARYLDELLISIIVCRGVIRPE